MDNPTCFTYDLPWQDLYSKYNDSIMSITSDPTYLSAVNDAKIRSCSGFVFDRSFWKRTIVQVKNNQKRLKSKSNSYYFQDFNLVCENEYKQKWTQQVTFFGLLCGVFASGIISDRIGRVKTMMIMLTMVIICGTLNAFAPYYELFLLGIWSCGFSSIGLGTVMYVWVMEILSGKF